MPTLAAIRYNSVIRKYYQHLLKNGKVKTVAVVACMRKIITILNSMLMSNQPCSHGIRISLDLKPSRYATARYWTATWRLATVTWRLATVGQVATNGSYLTLLPPSPLHPSQGAPRAP